MEEYSMYVCPECKKVFKVKGNNKKVKCSRCSVGLIDMNVSIDDWEKKAKDERASIIEACVTSLKKPLQKTEKTRFDNENNTKSSFFPQVEQKAVAPRNVLICELCGGKDIIKQNGLFVCQGCGCKYSLEEAKKMMGILSTGASKASGNADEKQQIEKYLVMCRNAQAGDDHDSVVKYSDKILEIDPNNFEAWYYRALAAGWGSSINNLKTGQIILAAQKTLEFAPENKRTEIADQIMTEARYQINGHINTAFSMSSSIILALSITTAMLESDMIAPVMDAWIRLVSEIPYLSDERKETEINDCKELCDNHKIIIGMAQSSHNGNEDYYVTMRKRAWPTEYITSEDIYIKKERKREEIEKYWEDNPERKTELDKAKKDAEEQLSRLSNEMREIPESTQIISIDNKVFELNKRLNELSVFKAKEKKDIQDQIDSLNRERKKAEQILDQKRKSLKEQIAIQEKIKADIVIELEQLKV